MEELAHVQEAGVSMSFFGLCVIRFLMVKLSCCVAQDGHASPFIGGSHTKTKGFNGPHGRRNG